MMMSEPYGGFVFRDLRPDDQDILFDMLYQAIFIRSGAESPARDILQLPEVRKYAADWGREGDYGIIAEEEKTATPAGAVWIRFYPPENRGYGYIAADIPEMSIAVDSPLRGKGLGTVLLNIFLNQVRKRVKVVSLSVNPENPAVRLYERAGFRRCGFSGDSLVMRIDF